MQVARLAESLMAPGPVDRDAQQLGAEPAEVGQNLVVQDHLVAADWAPVGRIEGQDHPPSLQLGEGQLLIRRDVEGEVRGRRPRLQYVGHVPLHGAKRADRSASRAGRRAH